MSSPLSPRLDSAVSLCREAEERAYLRRVLPRKEFTSSTSITHFNEEEFAQALPSPSSRQLWQECKLSTVQLSPRLTQVITKCAETPNQAEHLTRTLAQMALSSTISVANKFDSEEEAQQATVNPCMRRVWTECERIASSLAAHFALSHGPGRKGQQLERRGRGGGQICPPHPSGSTGGSEASGHATAMGNARKCRDATGSTGA